MKSVHFRRRGVSCALVVAFALCGCGGGGGASTSSAPSVPAPGTASVAVSLTIPTKGAQSKTRTPQVVPTNTSSISLNFGNGVQNFNTGPGSAGCTSSGTSTATEFSTSSQPRGITRGPDGNIWYVTDIGWSVGSITPAGVQHEQVVGTDLWSDTGIVFGSDGLLYAPTLLNDYHFQQVTLINTSYTVQTRRGSLGTNYASVGTGYDGAIWLSEWGGAGGQNFITRMNTSGGTNTFGGVPNAPGRAVAGPDSAEWFPEGNKLGRLTISGGVFSFSEVTVPNTNAGVGEIVVGPDNQLWFPEFNLARMGRYNPSTQKFSEIVLPTGGIGAIVAGTDAVYYSGGSSSNLFVGRVTADGSVTTYPYTNGNGQGANTMAVGSDGAIYMTDNTNPNGKIDKVAINVGGGVSCSFSPVAPVGNDTVTIKTYDATGGSTGTGHVLSATSVKVAVLNGPNKLTFTLGGVVNNVTVSFSLNPITRGTPQAVAVNVTVTDPSGNVIVGSDNYADASGNPLTIVLTSLTPAGGTLSATSVTSPASLVTLNYDGSAIPSYTITPTVTGGSAAGTLTAGTLTIQ